jgi:hypothetical protein
MIRYLGDFKYDFHYPSLNESQQKHTTRAISTLNILLEFGDYDLAEYVAEFQPPVTFEETIGFWRDLFDVPREVKELHDLEKTSENGNHKYWGYVEAFRRLGDFTDANMM